MSDAIIDPLMSNRLPVKDPSGILTDSAIERSSPTFLVVGDGYEELAITALRVTGLTPENSNGGRLYAEIDLYEDTVVLRRFPRESEYWTEQEDLAAADLSPLGGGAGTLALVATEYHPGVSGSITLSISDQELVMELFVPLSSVEPLIAEDVYRNVSSITLQGVTQANSANGVLNWDMSLDGGDNVFTLSNPSNDMILAVAQIPDDTYLPMEFDLEEQNDSGVTGKVTFEVTSVSNGRLVARIDDQVHIAADVVIPQFAGGSARPLYVDQNGKIYPYTP